MILGILNESDNRVAMVPDLIPQLKSLGITAIQMVSKAGESAGFPDQLYKHHKVKCVSKQVLLSKSDIIITFNPISKADQLKAKSTAVLISRYAPYDNAKKITGWVKKSQTIYSLDMIPRITTAQSSDVLSSLASIAGYKAILIAAEHFNKYFPMLTTAAGSIPPAKILVLGAGVAGLQAIATARRLGAVVEAFDTRKASRDEVQSLGAKFVEIEGAIDDTSAGGYAVEQTEEFKKKQKAAIAKSVKKSDIIIATAQIRGKPAPKLITREMLATMTPGSIVVDLASSTGGNCEYSKDNKIVSLKNVTIIGNSDLSEQVPFHASLLFSKNICNFMKFMINKENKFDPISLNHEILEKSCIIHKGEKIYK